MAQAERQRENQRGKKRGTSKRGGEASGQEYDLSAATLIQLLPLANVLALAGGALRVGLTRDKGALALGVYVGEEYGTEYVRPSEDLHEACEEILTGWLPSGAEAYVEFREKLYAALKGINLA